jgi:hypothetical protein
MRILPFLLFLVFLFPRQVDVAHAATFISSMETAVHHAAKGSAAAPGSAAVESRVNAPEQKMILFSDFEEEDPEETVAGKISEQPLLYLAPVYEPAVISSLTFNAVYVKCRKPETERYIRLRTLLI